MKKKHFDLPFDAMFFCFNVFTINVVPQVMYARYSLFSIVLVC